MGTILRTSVLAARLSLPASRPIYFSTAARYASSEAKIPHKDEVNPTSRGSTQSATDDGIAHDADASYNPARTSPVNEKRTAGREEGLPEDGAQNPLEYSGATPKVSHQVRDERPTKGGDRPASGGGKRATA